MIENCIRPEILSSAESIGLLAISFLAFSKYIKEQVRHEQGCLCAECGHYDKRLSVHHRVPQHMGGADNRENAVGLCREQCHQEYDELALKKHIIYPNIPIEQAPIVLWRNPAKYQQYHRQGKFKNFK